MVVALSSARASDRCEASSGGDPAVPDSWHGSFSGNEDLVVYDLPFDDENDATGSENLELPTPVLGSPVLSGPASPLEPRRFPPSQSLSSSNQDSNTRSDKPYWRQNLFGRFARDQKYLVTQWWPAELQNPGFLTPMLGAVFVAAASGNPDVSLDQRVERRSDKNTSGRTRAFAHDLTTLGNASTGAAIIGGAYLFARLRGHSRLEEATSLSAEALLDQGVWVMFLKTVTARTRPVAGGTGEFFQYKTQGGQVNGSFPSGHAMGAFTVATVFAEEYSDKKWVKWLTYGTASLIGASRVVLGRHFPSDVIAGAVLGHSIGKMVVTRSRDGELARPPGQLVPIYDPRTGGLGIGYQRRW